MKLKGQRICQIFSKSLPPLKAECLGEYSSRPPMSSSRPVPPVLPCCWVTRSLGTELKSLALLAKVPEFLSLTVSHRPAQPCTALIVPQTGQLPGTHLQVSDVTLVTIFKENHLRTLQIEASPSKAPSAGTMFRCCLYLSSKNLKMATSKEAEASWTSCGGYTSDTLDRKSADMLWYCLSVVKVLKYFHISW